AAGGAWTPGRRAGPIGASTARPRRAGPPGAAPGAAASWRGRLLPTPASPVNSSSDARPPSASADAIAARSADRPTSGVSGGGGGAGDGVGVVARQGASRPASGARTPAAGRGGAPRPLGGPRGGRASAGGGGAGAAPR